MSGKLIAIEGIDGSGKGTQAKRLCDRLLAEGRKVALFSFPRYAETRFGAFIGEYLNGRFGSLEQVHPFLAALLFAGDRFESRGPLLEALQSNDVVICDRYISSNIAHQTAKRPVAERADLIRRIESVEYGVYGLRRADCTILLDMSVFTAKRLIATKTKRTYTDRAEDLHEADGLYLGAAREVYLGLAERSPGWRLVACEADGALRSIDAIASDVAHAIDDLV